MATAADLKYWTARERDLRRKVDRLGLPDPARAELGWTDCVTAWLMVRSLCRELRSELAA